jgi:hypothetical protein
VFLPDSISSIIVTLPPTLILTTPKQLTQLPP